MMLLEDGVIRIRPLEPEDVEFMWEVESDSTQWIENSMLAPYSKEKVREYALSYNADPFSSGQLRLIVDSIENQNVRSIGIIDLYDISAQHRRAFIGIYIIKSCRNNGYGRRAVSLIETYSYKLLNLFQLGAKVSEHNSASIQLFRSSGYSFRGCIPDWLISGNEMYGMCVYTKKLGKFINN